MSETPTPTPPVLESGKDPVPAPAPGAQRTSGLAIASLICSLTCIGLVPAIICGHLARSRIRRDPTLTGRGFATAGLIISYATVIFAVGVSAYVVTWWSATFKEALQEARVSIVTNSPSYMPASMQMVTNESEQASSAGPGWTLDVMHAAIPDDPVVGSVHGADFQIKRALFRNGILRFLSADGQWVLVRDLGDSIANRSLEFQTASGDIAPKIEIGWMEDGQKKSETFQNGYAMELKFDHAKGRKIHGQIYLCLPDDSKSYVAGTFTIVLPKPKPKAAQ
jgi:hypothetical protein